MKESELLKSMWGSRSRRDTNLLVVEPVLKGLEGELNTDNWAFNISYGFRAALDLKREQRVKDKKPYMLWTQGPNINFKEGDTIYSNDGKRLVKVQHANQMGWDSNKNEMYLGSVVYDEHIVKRGEIQKNKIADTCNQMQFLSYMIYGRYNF